MPEPTAAEYRRRDDEALAQLMAMLTAQSAQITLITSDMHKMEIHMAELKALVGRIEQIEQRISNAEKISSKLDQVGYRVDRLEGNQKSVFGIITALATAVLIALTLWLFGAWGASLPIK